LANLDLPTAGFVIAGPEMTADGSGEKPAKVSVFSL
jgi:hypothetical protein